MLKGRFVAAAVLKDVAPDGGPLGLCPGSHRWEAAVPPPAFTGSNMGNLPGHVKCAAPAGGMVLFDMVRPLAEQWSTRGDARLVAVLLCSCDVPPPRRFSPDTFLHACAFF